MSRGLISMFKGGVMNQRPVVLFTEVSYYAPDFAETLFPRINEVAEIRATDAESEDKLIGALVGVDAVVVRKGHFTRRVFQSAPQLLGVVKWGVGVETIDIPAATEAGVVVANAPGNSIAVAEATMLLLLAVPKNFLAMTDAARSGQRPAFDVRGHEVYAKTLGIIGLGRIGRHLAKIAQGFEMKVVAYDPYVDPAQAEAIHVSMVDLATLLKESDFVSINCVLTPETHHLIGEEELALMKETAYLVNTARGAIIDEAALYRALKEGRIAGAGLDVFEEEPLKADNPLLSLPNVIATPHALSRAWESTGRTTQMIQDGILAILEGRLPKTTLSPEVRPRFAARLRGEQ